MATAAETTPTTPQDIELQPTAPEKAQLIPAPPSDELTFREGAETVFKLSFPIIVTSFFTSVSDMVTYFIIGGISSTSLGALGLGVMTTRIFSSDLLFSIASGYDTMGSQSFGKGEFKMVGIYLYRGLMIINLIGIPTYIALYFSHYLLLLLAVTPEPAQLASEYARRMMLNTALFTSFNLLNRFLIVQRIVRPQMWIIVLTASIHPLWVYFFAVICGCDFHGAAYAYTVTNLTNLVLTACYIRYSGQCAETLPEFDPKVVLVGWGSFLSIAGFSGLMLYIEFASYLIVNIFSGSLNTPGITQASLSANQALCNLHAFNFSIPVGIGSATCALVGNSIGKRNIPQAKHYAKLSVMLNSCIISFYIVFTITFRHFIASLYSSSEEVQNVFTTVLIFMLFSDAFDTTQGILCRILIAMAKQPYASMSNLICYFAYLVPMAYILLFWVKTGIKGIWIALGTSYFATSMTFAAGIFYANWDKIATDAADRIEQDKKSIRAAR